MDSATRWLPDITTSSLKSHIDKIHANGYKLIDIETYFKGDQVNFFTVYEKGNVGQHYFWFYSPERYVSLRDELNSKGFRLVDIELLRFGNEWKYTGFFEKVNRGWQHYHNYYWDDFKSILNQVPSGISLIDFEVYPRYIGIFDGRFTAENIGPPDPCINNPFSDGCQPPKPSDPCIDDPLSAGCQPSNRGGGPTIEIPKLPPELGIEIPPITEWGW